MEYQRCIHGTMHEFSKIWPSLKKILIFILTVGECRFKLGEGFSDKGELSWKLLSPKKGKESLKRLKVLDTSGGNTVGFLEEAN